MWDEGNTSQQWKLFLSFMTSQASSASSKQTNEIAEIVNRFLIGPVIIKKREYRGKGILNPTVNNYIIPVA